MPKQAQKSETMKDQWYFFALSNYLDLHKLSWNAIVCACLKVTSLTHLQTASLALRNVLGSFETISANASYGLDTSPMVKQSGTNYSLVWSKPILHPFHKIPFHSYVVSAYRNVHTQKLHSSYDLGVDGFQFKYRFPMLSEIWGLAQNEFNYDLIWREIKNAAPTASFEVREQVGHALKSSISHVLTYDTRDDPMLPRRGTLFRAASEVSGFNIPSGDSTVGLGGNVNHLKHESTLSRTTSLDILRLPTFTLTNTLKLGSLIPISPSESTHLSERFLTGGPLSIRGFEMHGLGPTAPRFDTGTLRFDSAIGRDGLGSNTYYGFSSGLMFPLLPRWKTKDVRGHLWANAGSGLDDLASSESILKKLRDSSSICIGAGLALKFSIIRLEINYCLPVRVISSDRVKSGWQWGVGMEFM